MANLPDGNIVLALLDGADRIRFITLSNCLGQNIHLEYRRIRLRVICLTSRHQESNIYL